MLQAGTWLPEPRTVDTPVLTDSLGRPFTGAGFAGHASVLFFGFTHCPDVCPTTLAVLAQVRQVSKAANLAIYLVTVDPERDSPEVLRNYLAGFDPEFIGLTGWPLDLKSFTRSLGAAGLPYVFHVADPWPDFPIAMGYLRSGVERRLAYWIEGVA